MKKILGTSGVFLILLCKVIQIHAQSNYIIGSFDTQNTSTTSPTPYQDEDESSKAQYVYSFSELSQSGIKAGNLIGLGFFVLGINQVEISENYTIGLGNTNFTEAPLPPSWYGGAFGGPISDVFGPINFQPVMGLNVHSLPTPFELLTNKSLLVQVCHAPNSMSGNTASNNAVVQLTQTTFRGSRTFGQNNEVDMCITEPMQQAGSQLLRPVMYLIFCYEPDAIFLNDFSSISAQIGWDHPGGDPSDQYEFVYGLPGFSPGGPNQLGTGTTTDTFTNIVALNGGETYAFYVRSLCDPSGFSRWAGPFQFTTDPSCGDVYNFNNFPTNTYDTSAYVVTTLCPDQPGVALGIEIFSTSIGPGDSLRIYNGISLMSPPLDTISGVGLLGNYRSTTATGCLTFEFTSDTSVSPIELGWLFTVNCAPLNPLTCYKVLQLDSVGAIASTKASFHWADMFGSPNYNYQLMELPLPPASMQSGTVPDTFLNLTNLVPGTRYRLLVQSACTNGINSLWDTIEFVTPLDCDTIDIGCNLIGEIYSRSGTGLWYTPEKACNPNNPTPTPGKEQLFTFVPPNTKSYTLEMYETNNGSVFVTYYYKEMTLGCDSLKWTCIGDYGAPGSDPMGSTLNPLVAGKQYLILADAQSTASVQQKFRIKDCGPPTNDLPENAVLIAISDPCDANIFANAGATYSLGDPLAMPPIAPEPDPDFDPSDGYRGRWLEAADNTVWFKFKAPLNETVTIYTSPRNFNPNDDTQVALYSVLDSSNYSTYTLLESDEDNGSEELLGFNSVLSYTGLTPGVTYYIQVDGWGDKEGTFCISVKEAAERESLGDCLTNYPIAIAQNSYDWYNMYATADNLNIGLLVAAINPAGNDLDSVYYRIQTVPDDTVSYGGIPHMTTYIRLRSFKTLNGVVSIRLFYYNEEFEYLKQYSNGPSAGIDDLVVSHYPGLDSDCEYLNNGVPFDLISTVDARQMIGSFYLEFTTDKLGEFVARLSDIALPLELLSFRGEALDVSNRLYWTTASEQNVEWHRLERSLNGVTWSEIGKIPAHNQVGVTMSYQFDDTKPPLTAYYRLRSTDFDGLASVSPAIQLVRAIDQLAVTAMYPSPTTDRVLVQFFVPREDNVEIRITDLHGRIVLKQAFETIDGTNQQELSLAHLPSGLYMITIHDSFASTEPLRVVKQ